MKWDTLSINCCRILSNIFETNPHGDVTAIGMWLVALISLGIIKHG